MTFSPPLDLPTVLLDYQIRWLNNKSSVCVYEKSRRIGISYIEALKSVLEAAPKNGQNTVYLSYNREMTKQFISDCAFWAKNFNIVSSAIETLVEDEDKDILTYEIRFASGKSIKALSSKPSNLRSRKGRVVIDEAAFCEDLSEILKAAMALLMWGGQVSIISTHCGEDNPFNHLIQQIKAGELKYSLHSTTLDDALADGLYKRICLTQGKIWTPQAQEEWRSQLYRDYGIAAAEELDCQPFSAKAGKVFNREWFEVVDSVPPGGTEMRFFDLAATAADVGKNSFYTCGVKGKQVGGIIYILDMVAAQVSPADGDALIKRTAMQDGSRCKVRWELEGGSAGKRDEEHLKKLLTGFDAHACKPLGDKIMRAKPFASEALNGRVKLLRGAWCDQWLSDVHQFDGTKKTFVNDVVDASSGLYSQIKAAPQFMPDSLGLTRRR